MHTWYMDGLLISSIQYLIATHTQTQIQTQTKTKTQTKNVDTIARRKQSASVYIHGGRRWHQFTIPVNTLQHTATHCNALQHTATQQFTVQHTTT